MAQPTRASTWRPTTILVCQSMLPSARSGVMHGSAKRDVVVVFIGDVGGHRLGRCASWANKARWWELRGHGHGARIRCQRLPVNRPRETLLAQYTRERCCCKKVISQNLRELASMAVLPDGRLASEALDGQIKLWPKDSTGGPVVLAHGSPSPRSLLPSSDCPPPL